MVKKHIVRHFLAGHALMHLIDDWRLKWAVRASSAYTLGRIIAPKVPARIYWAAAHNLTYALDPVYRRAVISTRGPTKAQIGFDSRAHPAYGRDYGPTRAMRARTGPPLGMAFAALQMAPMFAAAGQIAMDLYDPHGFKGLNPDFVA